MMIAVARVRPSKSIHEVEVAAVKKKIKDKAFARAVNRGDIMRGRPSCANFRRGIRVRFRA
jgi:predicted hydrolase (HD superfamily)